jgi:hypothetical protein
MIKGKDKKMDFNINKKIETLEDVKEYFNKDQLECLICGKYYAGLGTHLALKHKIKVDDYKHMFNLPMSKGLVGNCTCNKMQKSLVRRNDSRMRITEYTMEAMRAARKAGKHTMRDYYKKAMKDALRSCDKLADRRKIADKKAIEILKLAAEEKISIKQASLKLSYDHNTVHRAARRNKNIAILVSLLKLGKEKGEYNG